jgi:hypothetical protein
MMAAKMKEFALMAFVCALMEPLVINAKILFMNVSVKIISVEKTENVQNMVVVNATMAIQAKNAQILLIIGVPYWTQRLNVVAKELVTKLKDVNVKRAILEKIVKLKMPVVQSEEILVVVLDFAIPPKAVSVKNLSLVKIVKKEWLNALKKKNLVQEKANAILLMDANA